MKYAAKKIGMMLLTMVIVSFFAFLAFQIIPGDPTTKLLGTEWTAERAEALREGGFHKKRTVSGRIQGGIPVFLCKAMYG